MTTIHRIACPIPFPLKTANCYYIHDTHPMLIDTGVNSAATLDAIDKTVQKAGGRLAAIEHIVLTHGHTDHVGLAGRLAAISKATVFLHHWDDPKIISGDTEKTAAHIECFRFFLAGAGVPEPLIGAILGGFSMRINTLVSPLKGVDLLNGDETFNFEDFKLRVVHTPGHTAGSICLVNDEQAEIFSGDTLLEKITPNPVVEVNLPGIANGYRSIASYRQSLAKIGGLNAARVFPGHGPVFSGATERATTLTRHFDRRRQVVIRRLQRLAAQTDFADGMSLHRLALAIFPGLEGLDLFLALSEVHAYIELLEAEGLVAAWQDGSVWRYRLFESCNK